MRRYTEHELESMDIATLRSICKELNIKVETLDDFNDKDRLVRRIYKIVGTVAERYINEWHEDRISYLEKAIAEKGEKQHKISISVPSCFHIYKGIESLNDRGCEHKISAETDIEGTSAVLVDHNGKIHAFINVSRRNTRNEYFLQLRKHMLNSKLEPGTYRNFRIIFFPFDFDKVLRIYNNDKIASAVARFPFVERPIQDVIIQEIESTEDVLVIDYGTSNTTAGTYLDDKTKHIWFYSDEKCLHDPSTITRHAQCIECGRCALCPTLISVKTCDGENIELLYGHEAKSRISMARNSIFFDTKRWVNEYSEFIDVKDLDGNRSKIRRSEIIRRYIEFVIETAQQQNKVKYKNLCFISPVKQKAMSIEMYKNILSGYNVEDKDKSIDEAVAVVYSRVGPDIRDLKYGDSLEKSLLLIDVGGSTSDMVNCNYVIERQTGRSKVAMTVGYANGDTNFGGNNLTYRIMQYLKIKLAHFYQNKTMPEIDELLNISFHDVFEIVDQEGITKTYELFENAYTEACQIIPTDYNKYTYHADNIYLSVMGNFYFLWNLAERIKIDLYSSIACYEFSFEQLKHSNNPYVLFVKNERESFKSFNICPPLRILRDEINLLIKPEIYNLLKKFLEPYYLKDKNMSEIKGIMLSGQTTKIDLFRDVLKEYIAGHKARAPFELSYLKKLKCINGAVGYYGAKAVGRISASVEHIPDTVPYYLTVETFDGEREKTLIEQGQLLTEVYSYIDRTYETKFIKFLLKDHDKNDLQELKFDLHVNDYLPTTTNALKERYGSWLKQDHLDQLKSDGELRLFVYSDKENWGFRWLGILNDETDFRYGDEHFVPFESTSWEMSFFNGER